MKIFFIIVIGLSVRFCFGEVPPSNERKDTVILETNEAVSVFAPGLQVIVGRVQGNTLIHVRRAGRETLLVNCPEISAKTRIETTFEANGKRITVVDAEGTGVPNHRRVLENGKSRAEIFIDGKFIEPHKNGEKWVAEGREFEYRNGMFVPISAVK